MDYCYWKSFLEISWPTAAAALLLKHSDCSSSPCVFPPTSRNPRALSWAAVTKPSSPWSGIAISTLLPGFTTGWHRCCPTDTHGPTKWRTPRMRSLQWDCWPAHGLVWALSRSVPLCKAQRRCPLCTEVVHHLCLPNTSCHICQPHREPACWCYCIYESGVCDVDCD